MSVSNKSNIQLESRDIRVKNSKEQWARFDTWLLRRGCQSLAEGVRAAITKVVESEDESCRNSQAQSARAG